MSSKVRMVFYVLVCLIVLSMAWAAEVDAEVTQTVLEEGKVGVIVLLKDDSLLPQAAGEEQKKEAIAGAQQEVLQDLQLEERKGILGLFQKDAEFEVDKQYVTISAFAGNVTPEGLDKLLRDPLVDKVIFDEERHIFLADSVPLVNANEVWNISLNGIALDGLGETAC